MKRAKCKRCEHEAMVAVDPSDAVATLQAWEHFEGHPSVQIECAYCGHVQWTRDLHETHHAAHFADATRKLWTRELENERAKVSRLQEGRW